jgi:hypothetical protein
LAHNAVCRVAADMEEEKEKPLSRRLARAKKQRKEIEEKTRDQKLIRLASQNSDFL